MDLRLYIGFLIKRVWVIVFGTALVIVATFFLARAMTPIYAASTTLLVEQGVDPRTDPYGSILTSQRAAVTFVEIIEAGPTLERALQIADLDTPMSADSLAARLSVKQLRDTELINVSIEDQDPNRAQILAQAVGEAFIAQTQERSQARFEGVKADLEREIASLERQIDQKQSELASVEVARGPGDSSAPLFARQRELILQSELTRLQTQYSIRLSAQEDVRLASTRYGTTVTIASPPDQPKAPIRPNIPLYLVIAALLGLVASTGVAALMEYMDDTIKTSDDVEASLGIPTLGNVLHVGRMQEDGSLAATLQGDSRSPASEALRVLRTNVDLARPDRPVRSLLITSSSPGEGKTFVATGLAILLAQAGKRVILVDADLRRPSVHHNFGLVNDFGLTNMVLAPAPKTDDYLLPSGVPGLQVLVTGPIPPNPAELLGSEKMEHIISSLAESADVVVYDSPPVLPVTDAVLLSRAVDGTLIVVEAGVTRRDVVGQARQMLEQVSGPLLGVVINKLKPTPGYGYYYYYYHYSYGQDGRQRRRSGRTIWQRLGRLLPGNRGRRRASSAPSIMESRVAGSDGEQ